MKFSKTSRQRFPAASSYDGDHAAKIIQDAVSIERDDVANYCLPKTWPADREQRRLASDRGTLPGLRREQMIARRLCAAERSGSLLVFFDS
jgi:hypothetical protein